MELNALASWQSIGRDLYALGTLEQELQRARRAHQRRLRAIKEQKLVEDAKAEQLAKNDGGNGNGNGISSSVNPLVVSSNGVVLSPLTDPIDEVSDMEEVDYSTITGTGINDTNINNINSKGMNGLPVSPSLSSSMFTTPNAASPQVRIDGRARIPLSSSLSSATDKLSANDILQRNIATKALSSISSTSWPFWPLPQSLQSVIESKKISWRLLFFAYRTVRRFGKGFLVGWGVKALAGQLPALIRSRGQWNKLKPALLGAFGGDHFKMGAFIGGFLTLFQSLMRAARSDPGVVGQYRAVLAGGAAATSLLFLPESTRLAISLFFFVRALELIAYAAVNNKVVPEIPHADTLLMALSSAEVIWAALFQRPSLDKPYMAFLDHHSGKIMAQKAAYTSTILGEPISEKTLNTINGMRSKLNLGSLNTAQSIPQVCCNIVHPHNASCGISAALFLIDGLKRALPVYIPVYLIPLVLFKGRKIVTSPLSPSTRSALTGTGIGIARSALFLSSFCTIGWLSQCYAKSYFGLNHQFVGALGGFCAGSMVAIEKKHRRLELALYVLTHATQSSWRVAMNKQWVRYIPYGEVYLFMASMAIIMEAYTKHPSILRPSYFRMLNFFFGSGEASWAVDPSLSPSNSTAAIGIGHHGSSNGTVTAIPSLSLPATKSR